MIWNYNARWFRNICTNFKNEFLNFPKETKSNPIISDQMFFTVESINLGEEYPAKNDYICDRFPLIM